MLGQHDIAITKQELAHALALALAYFVTAALAVAFMRFNGGLSIIWIASSLLTADLRHNRNYSWRLRCAACGVASIAATTLFGLGPAAALPLAMINIGESLLSALLMRRYLPKASHLETFREIATLMLVPGLLSPAATGLAAAAVSHWLLGVSYWSNWLGWTTGHSLGALTILPFIKLALGGDFRGWVRKAGSRDYQEAGFIFAALLASGVLVFAQGDLPLIFLPLLPMMVAVFRLGRLGAACSIALLAALGIGFTLAGAGPFSRVAGGPGVQIQFLQLYLVTAILMTLPAAAELRRRNKLLVRAEEAAALHRVIADRSGDIILALEIDGTVRFASASIERTLGLQPKDPVGRPWQALALGADVELLFAAQRFMELAAEETSVAEFRMGKADGSLGYFESHGRATLDADGRVSGFVVVLREISERKARELDLERAADTDSLTGLLNRRGFIERFERLRTASGEMGHHGCIALFDLDHFKAVNDRHGHAMGDRVLVAFARTVASLIGEGDLAGRLGGEEFVAYFSKRRVEDAAMLCEAIRRNFEGHVVGADDGEGGRTTVSIGLAPLSEQQSLNAGLQAADKALYRAKGSGRNRVALAA